jgi:hypothetical protein
MGILGEIQELKWLKNYREVAKWQAQILPRQQSLHYIAVTAQEHLEEHVPHAVQTNRYST